MIHPPASITITGQKYLRSEVKWNVPYMQVKQVEANFRGRLDDLLVENTDLRHRLLNNTENFSRYKSNIERLQAQKITSLIEKVHTRTGLHHTLKLLAATLGKPSTHYLWYFQYDYQLQINVHTQHICLQVQILVRARKQADLSVAIGSRSQSNPTSRPNSAPITKSEIKQAGQQTASNRPHHS